MSRYAQMFARLDNQGAFGGFLMLGDPGVEQSLAAVDALVEGGVDFLELGIPFSDPVADGPVIQAAAQRALQAGIRTADCIAMIAAIRARHPDMPIGILTYANIAIARGFDRFVADLAAAGADSLLVADIPSLEAEPYAIAARERGLDWVMIAATNSPPATLKRIADLSSGFTYCVARAGVTGTDTTELHHRQLFDALAEAGAPPPILGFGISSPDSVGAAIREGAAGAVSGTAIVDLLHREGADALPPFIQSMKDATRTTETA